ncbi:MAG TPA: helix-turn-helix domain-containing protein [Candidatus Polarisedimenticolia bacterium]|nr:helix-turn-helix domain-containing protein [Candidatus Polarisedimenticolia bacterium]
MPLSLGSQRSRSIAVDGFRVTEVWFPPFLRLPPHTHDRASLAVMLGGSFDLTLSRSSHSCPPASVFTEPVGERHGNRIDAAGAHVIVVQPDPARADLTRPCRDLFDRPAHFRHAAITACARQLGAELQARDAVTPLAIEGTVLSMIASAARLTEIAPRRAPAWLDRTIELLHARFLDTLTTAGVAHEVGIHPVHLARVFRARHGMTMGAYVRRLRLDWAARRLTRSRDPLCDIAVAAGFADQSHFTRAFKRHLGDTPHRFRRRLAPRR